MSERRPARVRERQASARAGNPAPARSLTRPGGTDEEGSGHTTRVLLIEHLDGIGAAPADARLRGAALRAAHCTVEGLVLGGDGHDDLLYPMQERRVGTGFDVLDAGPQGLAALARRVRTSRADLVLWASTAPGGGPAARLLQGHVPALWWPSGHAGARPERGPLTALDGALAPVAGSGVAEDGERRHLSLWDGPYVLVPAPSSAATAATMIAAFALAADGCDEVDLVVLDHPEPALEELARRAGVTQRVHFVGPAPREAENAWLGASAIALLPGEAAISGGLLLRALACGCLLQPVGEAAAPLAAWLGDQGLSRSGERDAEALAAVIHAALAREAGVLALRERARAVAAEHGIGALGARIAGALRAAPVRMREAA